MPERAIPIHWSHHCTVVVVCDEEGNRDLERLYHELHDFYSPRNNIRLVRVGNVPQRGLIGNPEGTTQMGRRQAI